MNILPTDIKYEEFIGMTESQHVRPASDYMDEVFEYFQTGDTIVGDQLPWAKTHNHFRLRQGEVTIWGGINGHLKSMILGMTMLFLPPEKKILIASLEMKPMKTLARMARQGIGVNQPGEAMKEPFDLATQNIWLYDQQSFIPMQRMIGMITYMCVNHQIDHIVIDSLMMVISGTEDYNSQKQFMTHLTFIAKTHNCHIHLVHHVRKGKHGEDERINKFSVKGAGELVDLADNLVLTQINIEKTEARQKHKEFNPQDPDQWLMIEKQRDGEFKGDFGLWFDPATLRFLDYEGQQLKWRV